MNKTALGSPALESPALLGVQPLSRLQPLKVAQSCEKEIIAQTGYRSLDEFSHVGNIASLFG